VNISAGAGPVTLYPFATGTAINLGTGVGGLDLSDAELNRVFTTTGILTIGRTTHTGLITISGETVSPANAAGGIALVNRTGGIAIDSDLTVAGGLSLTANGGPVLTGSILGGAGILTTTSGNIVLSAATGIGDIVTLTRVRVNAAGTISATNTTSGDLFLAPTGNATVGVVGFGLSQWAGGALRVDAGGNLTVGGDVNTGAGSLELNAVGTITRTAGTLTAATMRLGTSGTATTIGVSAAARIITAATTLLDARSSTGAGVFLQNTGNVSITAQATAGAIDILNTGTTTSAVGGLISGTTLTVSSSGTLSIGHVLTGPTGVSLFVTGAGGLFSHTAGTIDGTDAPISIVADDMSLTGAGIGSAATDIVTLRPQTAARLITIGADTVGTLGLTDAELDTVAGTLVLGAITHAGNIVIDGGTSRTGELELATTSQISTAAGTIDADSLLIRAVGNVTLTSAVSNLAATHIGTVSPSMAITNTKAGGLTVTTVRGVNGIATNGGNLTLVETLGAMNVSQAIVTGAGTLALTLQGAGALLSTNATGTLSATNAALSLTADDMALAGAIGAGNGRVILRNYTAAQPITLGAAGGGSLSLLAAELDQVTTTGVLELGRNDASASALVTVGGPIGPANATILAITTGGGIAGAGQTITETSLALRAAGAINVSIAATTVAATTATGGVAIASAVGYSIGTVDGVTGLSSEAGQAIELSSGAAVTQLQPLNAGVAGSLRLSGTGPYTLTALGNQIGTLAANLSGAGALLSYSDADAFAVGTVGATNGITTAGGNVTLDTQSGADISLSYGPPAIDTGIGGGAVTFQDPVLLTVSTAITTGGGAGNIAFNSSLHASVADAQDLSLTAGLGSISFADIVGGTRLGDLTVVSANGGVSAVFSLAATSVTIVDGGAVDLNGAVTAPGGFSSIGTTFDNTGAAMTTTDSPITLAHTGLVTIGAILSSGAGNIDVDSGVANTSLGANITTAGGTVRFRSPLILATDIIVSSGAGNVSFDGTIIAAAPNIQGLTVNSTGTTRFNGSVGATRLKHLATNALGTTELNAASFRTGGAAGISLGDNVTLIVDTTMDASAAGPINVFGGVSGVGRIFTLANALSATFTGSVGSAGNLLAELAMAGTIATAGNFAFNGGLYATNFTVNAGAGAYGVTLGGGGQVTNLVTFNNTGALTITNGFAFAGGATKTTAGIKAFAGVISATNADLNFGTAGSVAISANATLNPGAATITLTGVTTTIAAAATLQLGGGGASTINTGAIAGAAPPAHLTINTAGIATLGAVGTNMGIVTVQQSGGTSFASLNTATFTILDTAAAASVSVMGNLTVGTAMSAAAGTGAYNVSILGAANTIAGTTAFANTGALTVQGITQFTLGASKLTGAKIFSGTITATGASNLNFGTAGAVTITGNTSFGGTTGTVTLWDTVINDGFALNLGNGAATIFSVQSVSGQVGGAASNLIIQNLGANATIANAVGPLADIGSVTVTKSGGTVSFLGNFEATSLLPGAGAYSLSFAGAVNQVSGAVTFLNSGNTAIGDQATDSFLFDNGVTAISGPKSIAGYLRTSDDAIAFQTTATTLSANAFIETGSAVADFGAVSDGGSGYALTLHANVAGSTGTITFNGLVTLSDLVSYARPYAVVMNAGSDIVQQVAFLNTGNLTLGDAVGDDFRFRAGVSSLSAGTNTFQGTVRTDGGNTQDIALDDLTVGAGNLTLNAGTGAANTGRVDISVLAAIGVGQILDVASSRFDINEVSNDGTLRLNGSQTEHSIGTMDLDSGVTEYYGSVVGQVFNTGIGAAGNRYYDLRINANAGVRMEIAGDIEIIRDLRIQSGRLDADAFDANIVVDRHWQNDVGFTGFIPSANLARSVSFTHTAVEIRGDNEWFVFDYQVNGGQISFANNQTQRVLTGGVFRVKPASIDPADTITLTRLFPGVNPANPPTAVDDPLFWFFELVSGATLDMIYVDVYYSNARTYPVSVPPFVAATPYTTYYCYKWLSNWYAMYSYTEDSNYNGKLDRIRVECEGAVRDDFSGFVVQVRDALTGEFYEVSGYVRPEAGANFYVLLREKRYLDTGATLQWRVVANTTLVDGPNGDKLVGNLPSTNPLLQDASDADFGDWMQTGDTAWPLIGYTLTIPGHNGTFIHFSEDMLASVATTLSDHRVSDLLISVPPTRVTVDDGSWSFANPDSWFVWPIWAWDRGYFEGDAPDLSAFNATLPGASDTASLTVGLVRTFDGTQWLRDQDLWIQTRTTAAAAVGTPHLFYDSSVAAEFRSVVPGLWLPSYAETDFSGLAGKPNTGVAGPDAPTLLAPNLWNNDLLAADAKIYDRAVFEFWYWLDGAPADLYAGRLEMSSTDAAIPPTGTAWSGPSASLYATYRRSGAACPYSTT
jgi:mucin-19